MSIVDYIKKYSREHDIAASTIQQMEIAGKLLCRFAGRQIGIDELSDDLLNGWLVARKQEGRSPATIRGNRTSILTLWYAAYEDGLIQGLPRRVRVIKQPDRVPECWTLEQLGKLLAACDRLEGRFRNLPVSKRLYARSLINAKYDTALRLSDVLSIERDWIWPGGYVSIVQSKTGRAHRVQFRETTLAEIAEVTEALPNRRLIWPAFAQRRRFYVFFRQLVRDAGLRGTSKWLRRSSASYFERENPGAAWRHLGHTGPGLDREHYLDPRVSYPAMPLPPAIH